VWLESVSLEALVCQSISHADVDYYVNACKISLKKDGVHILVQFMYVFEERLHHDRKLAFCNDWFKCQQIPFKCALAYANVRSSSSHFDDTLYTVHLGDLYEDV
jgi:hypothetical protein